MPLVLRHKCASSPCNITVGHMSSACLPFRLRADGNHGQFSGYTLVTNTWWLLWTHAPIEWKGANLVGGHMNVMHAWKVPGDVVSEARALSTCMNTASNTAQQSTTQQGAGPGGLAGCAIIARVNEFHIFVFHFGLQPRPGKGKIVVRLGRLGQQLIRLPSPQ